MTHPFGVALATLRRSRGLTQRQLSERSGVGLWALRSYEQGTRHPPLEMARRLCAELGGSLDALTAQPNGKDCQNGTPEKDSEKT